MNPLLVLVIILIVLAVAGAPGWGYHQLGYTPSIGIGTILVVILVLWLLGVFR